MLKKIVIGLFFLIFISLYTNAQSKLSHFLTDLSITDFKLGSSFADIKNNPKIINNLSVTPMGNNTTACAIKNQKINFFGIDTVDEVILNFKNDSLKSVVLEMFDDPNGPEFKKTYQLLKSKYGEPIVKTLKDSSKIYTWKENSNKLMLKQLVISFLIKYYN